MATPRSSKPKGRLNIRRKIPESASILGAIKQLFPEGYLDHAGYIQSTKVSTLLATKCKDFRQPPCRAADLFAIAGVLLMKSGGYHRIAPFVEGASTGSMIEITAADRKQWREIGREWAGEGTELLPPPPGLLEFWRELIKWDGAYLHRMMTSSAPRPWWKAAAALLAIADEAAANLGFETGKVKSAQEAVAEYEIRGRIDADQKVFSISTAQSDQVCILPKSRTPKVGCTLRSLSHHLALLPPRGMARAVWSPHPADVEKPLIPNVDVPFNLIIVPMPFQVKASAFHATPSLEGTWGWFHVDAHWCPKSGQSAEIKAGFNAFWKFIEALLAKAERDVGQVHGLVFPETALSEEVFRLLCETLTGRAGFELLVTGLFDRVIAKDEIRRGNFAAMARRRTGKDGTHKFDISIREKHHRWRVEKGQIETYSLGAALDINRGWWEQIDILDRCLDVFVIRGGATVTTLICEDLARSEPCQELVRAIGPNLVVALLMDGPQLKDRWPARYATVLAEDPGSSVLTVTSLGLIDRTNQSGQYPASDKIALWRDDSGKTVELSLGKGAQGLLLTLQPSELKERTLDGRDDDGGAQSWRLSGTMPVVLDSPDPNIISGVWPAKPA